MSQPSQVRTYVPTESAVFLKTNERFGGLSNMEPGFPLVVNGVRIRTSEALYQSCRFPHMPEVQRMIIGERSPMTAKMRSKPYHRASRPDWDGVRVKIMRWCLRVKLAQNWATFGRLLLSTGDRPIVEKKVRRKDFWGATEQPDGTLVGISRKDLTLTNSPANTYLFVKEYTARDYARFRGYRVINRPYSVVQLLASVLKACKSESRPSAPHPPKT